MENHIVPECYVDTMLVGAFLIVGKNKRLNHKHGCFNVGKELEKGDLKDKFGVGIIDNDKRQVDYLKQFKEVGKVCYGTENEVDAVILLKHTEKPHFFIQICPAIENWIIQICRESKIDLKNFGLTDSLNELKRITKSQSTMFDERFIKLFKAMRQSENVGVKRLELWLKILFEKNYQVDINELRDV